MCTLTHARTFPKYLVAPGGGSALGGLDSSMAHMQWCLQSSWQLHRNSDRSHGSGCPPLHARTCPQACGPPSAGRTQPVLTQCCTQPQNRGEASPSLARAPGSSCSGAAASNSSSSSSCEQQEEAAAAPEVAIRSDPAIGVGVTPLPAVHRQRQVQAAHARTPGLDWGRAISAFY